LQQSTKRKERDGQGKSAAFRPPVRPSSPPHARTHARGLLSSGTKTKGKRKKQPGTKGRIARISKCQQNTGLKEHRSNMWHTWRHGHSFSIAASHAATTQTKCAHTLSLSLSLSLSLFAVSRATQGSHCKRKFCRARGSNSRPHTTAHFPVRCT
jgi:hypothetical protein